MALPNSVMDYFKILSNIACLLYIAKLELLIFNTNFVIKLNIEKYAIILI